MHKVLYFIFCILISPLCPASAEEDSSKLLFVQILFRHGDRAPLELYPNDPNPESFWVEGLGKLTKLGRKQQFALGKVFRKMYGNFITTNPNEVNVTSSACDRCMKSAESNLASFFEPNSEWQFDPHINWQPTSIYYLPKDRDKLFETESYCPRAFAEQVNVMNSPESQSFIAKHKEMFENLTIHSGKSITNLESAFFLQDVLSIEKRYNLTIPSWANTYWDELQNVADQLVCWSYHSSLLLHRLRAGPLLKRMIEMMESKLAGDIPLQKVHVYSAHDINIALILDALNLFNMRQPPYCATLLLELHELVNGEKAVRLLFLNSSNPETGEQVPHILALEGCSEFCPLNYFINFIKHLIPNDWEKECQLDNFFMDVDYEKGKKKIEIRKLTYEYFVKFHHEKYHL